MRVAVVGAGLQGIATALDLAKNPNFDGILLGDYEFEKAKKVADLCNKKYGNKVTPVQIDVRDRKALAERIEGYDWLISLVNYYFNIDIMEACLSAGVNYIDIGGLYVVSEEQIKYHGRFKDAGLLAILGIGGCCGLDNVCARWAADQLDTVRDVYFYCGCNDWSKTTKFFETSYSIETIMDEFHIDPMIFRDGEWTRIPVHSESKVIQFPSPVGSQECHTILHGEVSTIPRAFREKGIRNCSFGIGFPKDLADKLAFLHGLGFSSKEEVEVDGVKVKPVRVLKRLLDLMPDDPGAAINDCDIIRTVVNGTKDGEFVEYELDAICRPVKEWPELMGAQVYIGGAPAWTAELIRRGLIQEKGVLSAEECIPPMPFFEEAAKREIYVRVTKKGMLGTDDWGAAALKERIDQGW
ncbi:MAG: saccharopine dehydrogenase NADP-binding domain-containing protein [Clostridiales Family XIII bacterium]|jgi:saccharopine dehydrogenase (NAD+, L-lysine-forming)|nr:saccharopine dehydrogenase NADP-binding domain-containing protein [Clostridiales Family XIII bacterium]